MGEHKLVYGAIVAIVAIAMTIFTTQNAIQAYQEDVTERTVALTYGDFAVTVPNVTPRQLLGRPPVMADAAEVANATAALAGFAAEPRASIDATVYVAALKEPCAPGETRSRYNYTADGGVFWGVDHRSDGRVSSLRPYLVEGSLFEANATYTQEAMGAPAGNAAQGKPTITGTNAPCVDFPQYYSGEQKPYPVIIGLAAARLHNLSVGDDVLTNMITTPERGTFGTPIFRVVGIYAVGQPKFEELNYFTPFESMREFQLWNGTAASFVAVKAPPDGTAAAIEAVAPGKDVHAASELKTIWIGNLGEVAGLLLATTIAAALLLAATAVKFVMDSVLVRKAREIGTLKALGATDGAVVRVFLYQALILGALAAALGYAGARAVMLAVERLGLSVPGVLGTTLEIRFLLTPQALALALVLPVAVALLAAILPAWSAARLAPVEAMRRGSAGVRNAGAGVRNSRRVTATRLAVDEMKGNAGVYAVIAATVAIALATYGLQSAFQANLRDQVRVSVRDTISGDAMVMRAGSTPRHALAGGPPLGNASRIASEVENATGYRTTLRTTLEGLVFFDRPDGSQEIDGIVLVGVDPARDETVVALADKLVAGSYFDPKKNYSQSAKADLQRRLPIWYGSLFQEGRAFLESTYPEYPILVGEGAAKSHNLKLGSRMSAVFNSPTEDDPGRRVYAKFVVRGIYVSGLPFNDLVVYYLPLVGANELRGFAPDEATAIIADAPGAPAPGAIAAALRQAAPEQSTFTWHDMTIYFTGAAFDAMALVTTVAIALTVALAGLAIAYAMDASVKRRTGEIGTLKALGARDATVVGLFLRQAAFLGLAAGALALVALHATTRALVAMGLDASLPFGARQRLGFLLTPKIQVVVFLVPLLVALAAAAPSAWRAARLSPVEALRAGELAL